MSHSVVGTVCETYLKVDFQLRSVITWNVVPKLVISSFSALFFLSFLPPSPHLVFFYQNAYFLPFPLPSSFLALLQDFLRWKIYYWELWEEKQHVPPVFVTLWKYSQASSTFLYRPEKRPRNVGRACICSFFFFILCAWYFRAYFLEGSSLFITFCK